MHQSNPQPTLIPYLILMTLLFTGLACTYPGLEDDTGGLPTSAPTPAPSEAVVSPGQEQTPPPTTADQIIQGSGSKASFGPSPDISCQVTQPAALTLHGDGTAELVTTGPSFIDHYNCTTGTDETWYINGSVNAADQTVTFSSCNDGGFTANGVVSFEGGTLSGNVTCIYKDGSIAISLALSK